jgi:iron complex outermembrane receptor protein
MNKVIVLFLYMTFFCVWGYSQNKYALNGKVLNTNEQTLPRATVVLKPINKGTITDKKGNFTIKNIEKGFYQIEVTFIGYNSFIDSISIINDKNINIRLEANNFSLQEVVITDDYARKRKEEALNIEIVNDNYLKQNLGGSLMNSLERLPGVTTIDIGSGQSKPVIRGLSFNRVVVTENGIKHEGQQWGADHGLEIDQYAIDNIEVIKGPASLMYGSDAIGGVIDLKNKKLPLKNSIGGNVNLTGKSNNDCLGTSILLYGRKESFFADLRATILDYGDYKVPTDSVDIYSYRAPLYKRHLRNTAGKEYDFHLSFGITNPRFHSRFYVSNVYSKSGFFANAHGLEPRSVDTDLHDKSSRDINDPYQQVNHLKATNTTRWESKNYTFEINLGFQHNHREEWSKYVSHGYMPANYPDTLDFDPDLERGFDKVIYSGNIKATRSFKKTTVVAGLDGEYQNNKIDGRGFIIPGFKQFNVGGYAFSKHFFSKRSILQMGVRYDLGNIKTREYCDWFPSPVISETDTTYEYLQRAEKLNCNFSNTSWSVGYNYNPNNWSLKANIGKSFRMPIAKELAANGVNYHHFSYEVGDPDLDPEISYQLDLGAEYNSNNFAIGTTPFLNYFSNYIYLNPTSEHDQLYGNGNQVYYYTQCRVIRFGGEIHAHYELAQNLQLGFIGEYVYSEQLSGAKKGYTLPFSPPASAIINVKYHKSDVLFLTNTYLSVDYRLTASQNKIVPPEKTTDGYQVMNIKLGGDLRIANQKASITMQVNNLLNKKYFNHTSYYRLINVPEPGRNFILNISIPFSAKI